MPIASKMRQVMGQAATADAGGGSGLKPKVVKVMGQAAMPPQRTAPAMSQPRGAPMMPTPMNRAKRPMMMAKGGKACAGKKGK